MAISLFRQPCLAQSGGKVIDIRLVLVWLYSQVLCDREARRRQQDFGGDFPRTGDSVRVSVARRNIGERPLWNDWSMRKVGDGLVVLASNEVGDAPCVPIPRPIEETIQQFRLVEIDNRLVRTTEIVAQYPHAGHGA